MAAVALLIVIVSLVEMKLFGPDHEYDVPPAAALNPVCCPWQITLLPVILHGITGFIVTVLEQELVHPFASVTVTE